jgi:SAM-dependent methyltransferase
MTIPTTYSFTRYLAAKKSVDDRALNRHVWGSLARALPGADATTPLTLLEIGAGIGTMVEHLLDWGPLTHAAYTAIDAEPIHIEEARRRLPGWATSQDFSVEQTQGRLHFERGEQKVSLELEAIDLFELVDRVRGQKAWDLLIAHAFMDLVDVPAGLPTLFDLLRPGGLFYFTLVFDGATLFQPVIDPMLDARIEAFYHQTMDRRITGGKSSGGSRTGRHLFGHLQAAGAELLDAGSSDWIVFPEPDGYPADEAYFLHFIIHTVQSALQGHPGLDAAGFADWIAQRYAQVEQGALVYITHQLDFLGRLPSSAR